MFAGCTHHPNFPIPILSLNPRAFANFDPVWLSMIPKQIKDDRQLFILSQAASAAAVANTLWYHSIPPLTYESVPLTRDHNPNLMARLIHMSSIITLHMESAPNKHPGWRYFTTDQPPIRFVPPVVCEKPAVPNELSPENFTILSPILPGARREGTPQTGDWVPLDPSRIALPAEGTGATVDLLSLLPPAVADLYREPLLIRHPPPSRQELKAIPILRGYVKGGYPDIIRKLLKAGLITLNSTPPKVMNGVFGVTKDEEHDRLIFDGRRCNLFFEDPPHGQR